MRADLVVRPALTEDMPAVAAIYAWYVAETVVTFELEPPTTSDWQNRLTDIAAGGWPFLVGAVADEVVGYAYVGPWRARPAYRHTVEDAVYLARNHTGRGHGQALLRGLLAAATAAGAHEVIAVIADSGSAASISLHRALGFADAGRLSGVGFKQDRWIDVLLMQASLHRPPHPRLGPGCGRSLPRR